MKNFEQFINESDNISNMIGNVLLNSINNGMLINLTKNEDDSSYDNKIIYNFELLVYLSDDVKVENVDQRGIFIFINNVEIKNVDSKIKVDIFNALNTIYKK